MLWGNRSRTSDRLKGRQEYGDENQDQHEYKREFENSLAALGLSVRHESVAGAWEVVREEREVTYICFSACRK